MISRTAVIREFTNRSLAGFNLRPKIFRYFAQPYKRPFGIFYKTKRSMSTQNEKKPEEPTKELTPEELKAIEVKKAKKAAKDAKKAAAKAEKEQKKRDREEALLK